MYKLNEPLSSRDEVELVLGPREGGEGRNRAEGREGEGDDGAGLGEAALCDDEGPEPLCYEECDGDGDEVKKRAKPFLQSGSSMVRL